MHPRIPSLLALVAVIVILFILLPHSPVNPTKYICSSNFLSDTLIGHRVAPDVAPAHDNVVIYMLAQPHRFDQAAVTLRSIENSFNRRLKYPYVVFMSEDELGQVTDEMRGRVDGITDGKVTFATLRKEEWDVPEHLDKSRVEESLRTIGFSMGYRSMCRFNSGLFYRHPALAKYDWIWRIDSDIEFHCDVNFDPIQRMIDAKALYGFIQIARDYTFVQPTLVETVSRFVANHSDMIPLDANLGFGWKSPRSVQKLLEGHATNEDWIMSIMYNNFEISHRSVWESELYAKFFDYLDEAGGFFYERWGDAPVHSLGISMLLKKDQVMHFSNEMGYQHPANSGWSYGCARSSPLCTCNKAGRSNFNYRQNEWFKAPEYDRSGT
ncbi:hypothetical protein E1B28_009551 [Marasmius oreades]|uniref:Glycosyltransferase family 15 protein n=1 Tax=Marasmius oreades TaxID=181124 RepID=A0A9P7RVG7_9AGAR|nr:uncharacterized protein E1B28_009551 [Marasmius oreades]KAG7090432.1 hypothetical protein E1B28_009551 [Marasmius oreades]